MTTSCTYCGTVPDVETMEQAHVHLASETHRAMVELRYELDARTYTPARKSFGPPPPT